LLLSDGELINPWVACALPDLGHSQMLWLTHHLQPCSISPGERLSFSLHDGDALILVTGGCLEARQPDGATEKSPPASLGEGSHLLASQLPAEIELRAAQDASLDILKVTGLEFTRWLAETPGALATLQGARLPCRRGEGRA
jgi:hypothetical protein